MSYSQARWSRSRGPLVVGTLLIAITACGRHRTVATSGGDLATGDSADAASSPDAAGPAVQVTKTDDKSVERSTRFELTDDNFSRFLAASDSIAAVAERDSSVKTSLARDITNAGSNELDAGLGYLNADSPVVSAITQSGLTVRNYYIEAIAIASAARFTGDPDAAPPTATLRKNARFLQSRTSDLDRLRDERKSFSGARE